MNALALAVFAPFALCMALVAFLRRSAWAARLLDRPNDRSLHVEPTPRLGGIAMMLAALPVAMLLAPSSLLLALALAMGLALVSFADDLRSLPVAVRLAAHFAASALVVVAVAADTNGLVVLVAATIALAWMTNLYNFMDGADGLAGGMAVIGFGTYAIAAMGAADGPTALVCVSVASAAAAFLCFNLPPARIFMGDAGSIPLGFLAGAIGLSGVFRGLWPAWFPILVFSPFIVDASVTIVRRLLRRERVWIAHRSHFYQRLVVGGWSSRRLALAEFALMAGAAASALAARTQDLEVQCAIIALWALLYVVVLLAIQRRSGPASAST